MQDCSISSALALDLLQSYTKPSIFAIKHAHCFVVLCFVMVSLWVRNGLMDSSYPIFVRVTPLAVGCSCNAHVPGMWDAICIWGSHKYVTKSMPLLIPWLLIIFLLIPHRVANEHRWLVKAPQWVYSVPDVSDRRSWRRSCHARLWDLHEVMNASRL